MVSSGAKPAVISALMKYRSTEWARQAVNDAMDIQGGKAICDGPSNFAQAAYQSIPVSITVEGANILTRSLMVIAQGALRSHPWLFKEIEAAQNLDEREGFKAFERAFEGHVGFAMANIFGSFFHNVTFGMFGVAPSQARYTRKWYRQAYRAARNFALVTDLSVALLGGGLKTKQRITGRLADALSELYFLCCALKRFEDDGEPQADRIILDYCAQNALSRFYAALQGVIGNFPNRAVAILMRVLVFPLGNLMHPARDRAAKPMVALVLEPTATRDRLTREVFISKDPNDALGILEAAFVKAVETEEINKRLERAVKAGKVHRFLGSDFIAEAVREGVVTEAEGGQLREREALIAKVIAVDHFDADDVTGKSAIGHNYDTAGALNEPAHAAGGEYRMAE
jgi:acyl-CoA dehydrogenase